jgi:methionine-rich copper-binding protein CopC
VTTAATNHCSPRACVRAAAVLVLTLLVLLATAGPAVAHATLQTSSPEQGQVYPPGQPPARVVLEFDEPVDAKSAISLYADDGKQVRGVEQRDGSGKRVIAALLALADGAYAFVWHVVSQDGHPEHGVVAFSVGSGAERRRLR